MRLSTVFLIILLTSADKYLGLEIANNDNGPPLEKLLGQSPDNIPKQHHEPFGNVYKEGFQPNIPDNLNTANDKEQPLDTITLNGEQMPRYYPVPFGHIFKEGFDPLSKDPVDILELQSYYVKNNSLIRQLESQKLVVPIIKPKVFLSPKDLKLQVPKDEFNFDLKEEKQGRQEYKGTKKDILVDFNFASQHLRNLQGDIKYKNPSLRELIAQKNVNKNMEMNFKKKLRNEHRVMNLAPGIFDLQTAVKNKKKDNTTWTTCNEFGKKADFHPKDIVDVDWIPFYAWLGPEETMEYAIVHKFSYPTIKVVQYYKEMFGPHLNDSLDWEQPKLLLQDFSETLLIAVGRRGLFNAIPRNEIPEPLRKSDIIVPTFQIRLKIVDPYLAMMICDRKFAVIMANPGNEPYTYEDMISEAKTLKFKGTGKPIKRNLR